MSWLSDWAKRKKIIVDKDQIDSALTHFPIAVNLGENVGQVIITNVDDVTDIFDELVYPYRPDSVDDEFTGADGDLPDPDLWDNYEVAKVSIQSNQLNFICNNSLERINSVYTLSGDFDLEFSFDATGAPNTDYWDIGMRVNPSDGSSNTFLIQREYSTSLSHHIESNSKDSGSWQTQSSVSFSSYTGKLRITRVGDVFTSYYDSSGTWTQLYTDTLTGWSTETIVNPWAQTSISSEISLNLDDFKLNSGSVVWPVLNDNFSQVSHGTPNSDLWNLAGTQQNPYIDSNKLRIEINNSSLDHQQCKSNFYLSGDFDIQIDYDLITYASTDTRQAGLYLYSIYDADNQYVFRIRYNSGDGGQHYYANEKIAGTWSTATKTATTDISGKFRLVRSGSTITSYKWNGSSWGSIRSTTGPTTDMFIYCTNETLTTAQNATVNFDNFKINSGTVVWPEATYPASNKIAITKSDGETQIFAEIEYWDSSNEKALLWVSSNDLVLDDTIDTELYIYFDVTKDYNDQFISSTAEKKLITSITGDFFDGTNDDPPNAQLWEVNYNAWFVTANDWSTDVTIQGNKLRMKQATTQTTASYANIWSTFVLSGDFDIQVDVDVSDWTNSTATSKEASLYFWYDEHDRGLVRFDSEDGFYCNTSNNDVWTGSISVARTNSYGKLRIIKTGTSVVYKYLDGAGSWTTLATHTFSLTSDLHVSIFCRFDEETFYTEFDNFTINYGTVKIVPAENVWHQDFVGVYNLAQNPNGDVTDAIKDSTRMQFHGTPKGTMTTADLVDADVGKALDFDGTDDCIQIDMANNLGQQPAKALSFAVMVYAPDWSGSMNAEKMYSCTEAGGFGFDFDDSPYDIDNSTYISGAYQKVEWVYTGLAAGYHLFYSTFDGTTGTLYVDGVSVGTFTSTGTVTYNATAPLLIAAEPNSTGPSGNYWSHKVSFAEISWKAKSAAWIKAFYKTITDSLLTFGSTEEYASLVDPTVDPVAGEYLLDQLITINCVTAGSTCYYTTDGTDPDSSSTEYTGPIAVFEGTLKVVSELLGAYSNIVSVAYTIIKADSPEFIPPSGTYSNNTLIELRVSSGKIYYTNDGSTPYETASQLYFQPIPILDGVIKAITVRSNYVNSDVSSASYAISEPGEWDEFRNQGSWDFTPEIDKVRYNEGDKISNALDPVWKTKKTGIPITPNHVPCGYWHKNYVYTEADEIISGILHAVGSDASGQLGDPSLGNLNVYTLVTTMEAELIKDISMTSSSSTCIDINGYLWFSGNNTYGKFGLGNETDLNTMTKSDESYAKMDFGQFCTIGLTESGKIYTAGYNSNGQCGLDDELEDYATRHPNTIFKPEALNYSWIDISAQGMWNIAIKSDGTMWVTGSSIYVLGYNNDTFYKYTEDTEKLNGWTHVYARGYNLFAKRNGKWYAQGQNNSGELGLGNTSTHNSWQEIGSISDGFEKITVGHSGGAIYSGMHSAALKSDGTIWSCGSNYYGELGHGDTTNRTVFTQIGTKTNWIDIIAGQKCTIALNDQGELYGCGSPGVLGGGSRYGNVASKTLIREATNGIWKKVNAEYSCNGSFALK